MNATLHGQVTGPNSKGDLEFHFTDKLRGKCRIPIHPMTEALSVEASRPETTTPPVLPEVPAGSGEPVVNTGVPGPGASLDELRAFCAQSGIEFHHLNKEETLRAKIAAHISKSSA